MRECDLAGRRWLLRSRHALVTRVAGWSPTTVTPQHLSHHEAVEREPTRRVVLAQRDRVQRAAADRWAGGVPLQLAEHATIVAPRWDTVDGAASSRSAEVGAS